MEIHTEILQPTAENILRCANELKKGGLVAFPTETVYALGAVATNAAAVKRVFEVKGRPLDRPLIVAVSKTSDIKKVVKSIPQKAEVLIKKFMPGALTLLFDRADCIPDVVTAGSNSVAVRIPNNAVAQQLIALAGGAVVVPSANTSDKPSTTLATHVKDDLDGCIKYILDGGESDIGIESTIVDVRTDPPAVLRVGGVPVADIEKEIGKIVTVREKHTESGYVPKAEVLFSAFFDGMAGNITARYDALLARGISAVILCLDGNKPLYGDRKTYTVGNSYADYAHSLFAALRRADSEHIETVIAEGVDPDGIGSSLIAKLIKLSGGMII